MGRVIIWIGGIFATIGLVFVAVAGWRYLEDRSFAAAAVHATGTVIRMEGSSDSDGTTYRPVVSFRDAGGAEHIFGSGVSSSPPRYAAGDTVEVMYDPDSPDEAVIDSVLDRFFLALVFGGLGTVFSAIGGGILFYLFRKHQIAAQLRATGLPIQAKVLDCYLDTSLRVNGRNPWRVACEATHPATGRPQVFKSEALWVDPSADLAGKQVRVLVDPARPNRYLVDLSPWFPENTIG